MGLIYKTGEQKMCEYIKKTENRLTADEKRQLMDIFAPKNIAVPDQKSLCDS